MAERPSAISPRLISDARLLAECREDRYRGSGPGGQKRNKTSNAVRLRHETTGLIATATESRSMAENKLWAMRRLRIRLATDLREPIDLPHFSPPDWFLELRRGKRIEVSHRHPHYAAAAGLMLDLLHALGGNPAAVAINLGVSTTAVLRFLEGEASFWMAGNRIRNELGLEPLTRRN